MKILVWRELDAAARERALARPPAATDRAVDVRPILDAVRQRGDVAVREYTQRFDQVDLEHFAVRPAELAAARARLQPAQLTALERAADNIERFHRACAPRAVALDTEPGVHCERVLRPIGAVGLYVPAGSAPLPSTALMLAIPARIAGCPERILVTPPQRDGSASPAVLAAAAIGGIDRIFKIGGAQAIAALAYGTPSVPKVHKIFGPGNAWVTAAKQCVAADPAGAALDLPAGPSEALVLADAEADARFVAADLLAQAEHDPLAQVLLVTDSEPLARAVVALLEPMLAQCSRRAILEHSLVHARALVTHSIDQAIELIEVYAPEHLIVQTRSPRSLLGRIGTAGSVFLGPYSPEPLGDYCAGTNHVLPTFGYARAYGGLSVQDFMRTMTVQEVSADGLRALGPTARTLALLEGLDAHALAVDVRLARLAERHP